MHILHKAGRIDQIHRQEQDQQQDRSLEPERDRAADHGKEHIGDHEIRQEVCTKTKAAFQEAADEGAHRPGQMRLQCDDQEDADRQQHDRGDVVADHLGILIKRRLLCALCGTLLRAALRLCRRAGRCALLGCILIFAAGRSSRTAFLFSHFSPFNTTFQI